MTKKKVLVTGADSSLGRYLHVFLDQMGVREAYTLSGTSRKKSNIEGYEVVKMLDFTNTEIPSFDEEFDYVFHFAAALPRKYQTPEEIMLINVERSLEFFESIKLKAQVLFVLHPVGTFIRTPLDRYPKMTQRLKSEVTDCRSFLLKERLEVCSRTSGAGLLTSESRVSSCRE